MSAAIAVTTTALAGGPLPLAELAKPGRVLILRHALAPGIGEPPHFTLDDCSTRRNLDAAGRFQAALGRRLTQAGLQDTRVCSSEWCRCLETTRLPDIGPVTELPAHNSFFDRRPDCETNIAVLRAFLTQLPADGQPVVLVMHQDTITAITGCFAESAGGAIVKRDGIAMPHIVGKLKTR